MPILADKKEEFEEIIRRLEENDSELTEVNLEDAFDPNRDRYPDGDFKSDDDMVKLIKALEKSSHISKLYLGTNGLCPIELNILTNILEEHPSLTVVDLSDRDGSTALDDFTASLFSYVLVNNKKLEVLNLEGLRCSLQGVDILLDGLRHNACLTQLGISPEYHLSTPSNAYQVSFFNRQVCKVIAGALLNPSRERQVAVQISLAEGLTIFSAYKATHAALVRANKFRSASESSRQGFFTSSATDLEQIIQRLQENDPTLTALDLSNIFFADQLCRSERKQIVALLCAIADNTTLKELKLASNGIRGETEVNLIADILKKHPGLTTLDLSWNKITDADAKIIAGALRENSTLIYLNVSGCKMSVDGGVKTLITSLEDNHTLQELDVTEPELKIDNLSKEKFGLNSVIDEVSKARSSILPVTIRLTQNTSLVEAEESEKIRRVAGII